MNRYNANVRTGNWYDDVLLQDEMTKQYVRKTKNGELKVQKARQLFISLLAEIPLTFPVVGLSYGAVLGIVSTENPPRTMFQVKEKQGIALASYIDHNNCDERSTFAVNDPVIGTGLTVPCARNVWTLIPEDPSRNGKELRFGDVFTIKLFKSDPPLYVYAPVYKPSCGDIGECNKIVPKLTARTGPYTRFRVVHYDPTLRIETEGAVVPPFETISILQAANMQALAVEPDTWFPTYFGMECEVSVHTYKDNTCPRKPDPRNGWAFMLSR